MSSILTVSQLSTYLRLKLQSDVKLKGVAVKGEITDLSLNSRSGHLFFSLKDCDSLLRCIMFSSNASKLTYVPENGMSVLAFGNIEIYPLGGYHQLIASELQPLGAGTSALGLEQLKRKLAAQGFFDSSIKKKIPLIPKKIAVVTSPSGAAIRDIINVLGRRFPIVEVEIFPTAVQGASAPDSISKALLQADHSGADTLILARGGGSDEDLSAFNSEKVTVSVYNCNTPVISAVGHETDTSLCDLAADLRAPTPSAAAELATPEISQLIGTFDLIKTRLDNAVSALLGKNAADIMSIETALGRLSPGLRIEEALSRAAYYEQKLDFLIDKRVFRENSELDRIAAKLSALSPFGILERGYTMVSSEGEIVTSVKQIGEGSEVRISFSDGDAVARINKVNRNDL